jgi:hypothetical protein
MNDQPDERFEDGVAAGLKELGTADPAVVDRIGRSISAFPDRTRPRSIWIPAGRRWLVGLAAAIAVLALTATLPVWLAAPPARTPAATAQPSPSSGPASQSTVPTPTADLGPARFAKDPRMLACERAGNRTLADVQFAFELAHGKDYRANLRIPVEPALASASEPALVVVFATGDSSYVWPPPVAGVTSKPIVFTPPPGSRTVCVGLTGTAAPVLLSNLDPSSIALPPASPPPGPIAGVFADTKRPLAAMAWDGTGQSLWVVTWNTLTRVGLDGKSQSWPLPNGPNVQIQPAIQAGLVQPAMPAAWYGWDSTDMVVDGQGKVWIAAGYGLVEFDPETGRALLLKVFPEPDMTKVYVVDGGDWISAIAADGDGVLIARNVERSLTRVSETGAETGPITLPQNWTGARGLAILGDRILVGRPGALGVFDRTGTELTQTGVDVQFQSLRPIGSERAAVLPTTIGESAATVVDRNGAVIGSIALPMEPIHDNLAYHRLVVATDWTDRVWYGEWDDEQPIYLVEEALAF